MFLSSFSQIIIVLILQYAQIVDLHIYFLKRKATVKFLGL